MAALRLAMERYGERITSQRQRGVQGRRDPGGRRCPATHHLCRSGTGKPAAGRDHKAQAKRRPGVSPVGQKPPPGRRNGLHTLGQPDQVRIEAQRPVQAPTQSTPTPPAAKVQQPTRPAPSELEQREARLRAQMEAKKAKRQDKGNGCGR
nr:hypothetical protein [Verminephrobacter eiseniae]